MQAVLNGLGVAGRMLGQQVRRLGSEVVQDGGRFEQDQLTILMDRHLSGRLLLPIGARGQPRAHRRSGPQAVQASWLRAMGGMVLARTTGDPALRTALRAAARTQALALLGGQGVSNP